MNIVATGLILLVMTLPGLAQTCDPQQRQVAADALREAVSQTENAKAAKDRATEKLADARKNRDRYDFRKSQQADLDLKKRDVTGKHNALVDEMLLVLRQMREGYYCSQCNHSKLEIERGGEKFDEHLQRVNGHIVPAPPEVIEARKKEFQKEILKLELESQILDDQIRMLNKKVADEITALNFEVSHAELEDVQASSKLGAAQFNEGRARAHLKDVQEMLDICEVAAKRKAVTRGTAPNAVPGRSGQAQAGSSPAEGWSAWRVVAGSDGVEWRFEAPSVRDASRCSIQFRSPRPAYFVGRAIYASALNRSQPNEMEVHAYARLVDPNGGAYATVETTEACSVVSNVLGVARIP